MSSAFREDSDLRGFTDSPDHGSAALEADVEPGLLDEATAVQSGTASLDIDAAVHGY